MADLTANGDQYEDLVGGSVTRDGSTGLLANDTSGNGLPSIVLSYTQPKYGSVTVGTDGSFTYASSSGTSASTDQFNYTLSNGLSTSVGTATIRLQSPIPVATDDRVAAHVGQQTVTSASNGLLSNDYSPDGLSLKVVSYTQPKFNYSGAQSNSKITIASDGSYILDDDTSYGGQQSFTYTVSNGINTSQTQVEIDTQTPDSPDSQQAAAYPLANQDVYVTRPGVVIERTAPTGLFQNDFLFTDKYGPEHLQSYAQPLQPSNGVLAAQSDGAFTYTPKTGFAGVDTGAVYFAGDSRNLSSSAETADITFYVVNSAPLPSNDIYSADPGTALTRHAAGGLLTNDVDADGDTLFVSGFTQPTHGSVSVGDDGSFTYNPTVGYTGIDSFSYTVSDGYNTYAPPSASVTIEVACFASNTLIRTRSGDVTVDDLAIGDEVVTSSGVLRRIRWLGHRSIDCRHHPRPRDSMPVRVRAHAFGKNRPARDLRVSPGHSLCVDVLGEVLIPAMALINGTSIIQEEVDHITYWHVELDSHDVILAENLPCESYLDMKNRGFFSENGVVLLAASPDVAAPAHADFCRPFHQDGPVLEAVRARLLVQDTERVRATRVA